MSGPRLCEALRFESTNRCLTPPARVCLTCTKLPLVRSTMGIVEDDGLKSYELLFIIMQPR
jgi:hypothetical protein